VPDRQVCILHLLDALVRICRHTHREVCQALEPPARLPYQCDGHCARQSPKLDRRQYVRRVPLALITTTTSPPTR
jgi:hypothetical protein